MAHQALYVKGDTRFNESFASFVEHAAVLQWLAGQGAVEEQAGWKRNRARKQQITKWFGEARSALRRLYNSGRPAPEMRREKARILGQLCARADHGAGSSGAAGTAPGSPCRYNNASLALHASYEGGYCAFERLFHDSGRVFSEFLERSREVAGRLAGERARWLEQGCSPVAPEAKL